MSLDIWKSANLIKVDRIVNAPALPMNTELLSTRNPSKSASQARIPELHR
jgi:hypothetical protein